MSAEGVALDFVLCASEDFMWFFLSCFLICLLCALKNHLSGTKMLIWSLYGCVCVCACVVFFSENAQVLWGINFASGIKVHCELVCFMSQSKIMVKVFSQRRFFCSFVLSNSIQRLPPITPTLPVVCVCVSALCAHLFFSCSLESHSPRFFYSIYSAHNSLAHTHKSTKCSEYFAIFYCEIS